MKTRDTEMKTKNNFKLVGCASGIAGADVHSGDGPIAVRNSARMVALEQSGLSLEWEGMVFAKESSDKRLDEVVAESCIALANLVSPLAKKREPFCVIGGDHTCAIGTWSGVYDAIHEEGELGFIWIDAHMDSHTPETSESGRIHGMPLACLLGYGFSSLTSVLHHQSKFKPENVCLIGVRSYEQGEADLLRRLNVRVYFMDEVKKRGFTVVLREAVEYVKRHTVAFGISLDIDSVDPHDAPGVDVPEADGIPGKDLCEGLRQVVSDPKLIATEVVEFDPTHDIEQKTESLVVDVITIIANGKVKH
jgi:arginase